MPRARPHLRHIHAHLRALRAGRFARAAAQTGGHPLSYALDAVHLSGGQPAGESVESLIKTTERGILVTGLSDTWLERPADLTLTAATRGGTFLIEDGEIAAGVKDLRFSRNLIEAFNSVEAFTNPADALSGHNRKMLLPAMKIRGFEIS